MTGKHRLQRTTKRLNVIKANNRTRVPANLGLAIGGQRLVEVPNRPGYHYARIRGNLSEAIQTYNAVTSPVYDLPVLITFRNSRWEVEEKDTGRYIAWGSSAFLPKHGAQHSFDPDAPGGDPVWVWGRQMMPLGAIPSGSNGGPNVIIEPSTYWQDNSWHYAGGTGTADITGYKPTGSNARMVLVYLDANGNPQLLAGDTYFNANLTGTSQVVPYIPAMPNTDAIGIAGIRLTSGTSTITWNSIYDLRPWIVGSGYIPTGTFGVTDHGLLSGLLDNDHPQYLLTGTAISSTDEKVKVSSNDTTAGYLNGKLIEGAGISFVEVGDGGNETLRIVYTGTSSVASTPTYPAIYDNNVFKNTGTAIHFNDGLNVIITGSSAWIDWTGTAGSQGEQGPPGDNTLLLYDDDTFKTTGSAIHFNNGLSVGVTGSVAYIDVTGTFHDPITLGAELGNVLDLVGQEIEFNTEPALTFLAGATTGGPAKPTFRVIGANDLGVNGDATKYLRGDMAWEVPPGGGGGGAIVIYDNSEFKITGSSISFDSNLTVIVTGSTAFVSSSGGTSTIDFLVVQVFS